MDKIAIAFTGATIGILLYLLSQEKEKPKVLIGKEKIICVLKELHEELFKVLKAIAYQAMCAKEEFGYSGNCEDLARVVRERFPMQTEISLAEEKVYFKNKITQEDFENAVKIEFANDSEVNYLVNTMKLQLENALKGVVVKDYELIPDVLTQKMFLLISAEVHDCELYLAQKKMNFNKENQASCESDEDFDMISYEIDLEIMECKVNIFKKFGIVLNERQVNLALRRISDNFRLIDEKFVKKFSELENKYNKRISEILDGTISEQNLERLKAKYYEYALNY